MIDLFSLDGRVAVVTGAGGRLGSAFAEALAEAGALAVVAGRDRARLAATAAAIGEDRAVVAELDVTDQGAVADLFSQLEREHGGIDILVNNAGVASDSPVGEITDDDLSRVLAVNVAGALNCAQAVVAPMRARGGGKIINVGSIYGTVSPDPAIYEGSEMVRASAPYIASKGALVSVTRYLAVQLAPHRIQVNMLSPGGIEADQPAPFQERYSARTPAGRMGTPADLIGTLIYLACAASDYVTGENVHVDGGFTAW